MEYVQGNGIELASITTGNYTISNISGTDGIITLSDTTYNEGFFWNIFSSYLG